MISSIEIKNFQSHKDTKIELSPNLNIFLGESNVGKSSILRAMRLLIYNRPLGDEERGDKNNNFIISFILDTQDVLTRVKGLENTYKINDSVYTSFGYSPPEDLLEFFKMPFFELDEDIPNPLYQGQFDSPFFLSLSESSKSRILGKLNDSFTLEVCSKSLLKDIRELSTEKKILTSEQEKLESDLSSYPDLDLLSDRLSKCKLLLEEYKSRNLFATQLEELYRTFLTLNSNILIKTQEIGKLSDIDFNRIYELGQLSKFIKDCEEMRENYIYISSRIERLKEVLSRPFLEVFSIKYQELRKLIDTILEISSLYNTLSHISATIEAVKTNIGKMDAAISKIEGELSEFSICPLCKQNLK